MESFRWLRYRFEEVGKLESLVSRWSGFEQQAVCPVENGITFATGRLRENEIRKISLLNFDV